jgi:hypothetical protein
MSIIPFSKLDIADLYVDALYEGGPGNSFQDEPLSKLLGVDNQGGFRVLGKKKGKVALRLLVLTTNMSDADWPDALDPLLTTETIKSPGASCTTRGGEETRF